MHQTLGLTLATHHQRSSSSVWAVGVAAAAAAAAAANAGGRRRRARCSKHGCGVCCWCRLPAPLLGTQVQAGWWAAAAAAIAESSCISTTEHTAQAIFKERRSPAAKITPPHAGRCEAAAGESNFLFNHSGPLSAAAAVRCALQRQGRQAGWERREMSSCAAVRHGNAVCIYQYRCRMLRHARCFHQPPPPPPQQQQPRQRPRPAAAARRHRHLPAAAAVSAAAAAAAADAGDAGYLHPADVAHAPAAGKVWQHAQWWTGIGPAGRMSAVPDCIMDCT